MSEPSRPAAESAGSTYPGERLGLPERGPGAVAGWPRRLLALVLDWIASMLVAALFFGGDVWAVGSGLAQSMPLTVFFVEVTLLTALLGGSFGQLACRVAVVPVKGGRVNLLQAAIRTFLICLVIPPLVFNRDQRGLHDLAVGTVTLRR